MATGAGMSGVIGRIKSVAPLSRTSGFETLSASNNGGFGLDWITDELMTVKRAHRLYISPIISVWRRGVGRGTRCRAGGIGVSAPLRGVPRKRERPEPRAGPRSPGLYHPLGAFNKSIQATRGLIHVALITGGCAEGGSVRGITHGGSHCSNPRPAHQDRESEEEAERRKWERGADRKEQWDRRIKDKSPP